MVDGSRLQYTGSAYKDVSVRATLVVRTTAEELKAQEEAANAAVGDEGGDDYEPMALRVMSGNPAMNAKTTTRPRPSSLDWGAEQLTLELPGPVQLPIFVQFLIRAKDANGQAVTLGHALGIIDSLNGSLNVTMIDDGSDGRPSTAPGGGGEVSQKPILPITTQKPTDLLKVEVEHAYKAVAQGHNAEERKGPDALILRCAYAVSTPFPALSADFLRTRQDESTLRAMNGGVASDDDAGKKPQLTGPPPLGSFAQGLLFDGPACVRELLKHGAPVGGTDLVTSTPLHKAVANGDQRAMQLLLGGGADINFQNMYGDTPVHRAVENSRLYTFTHLQRMGADINRPNKVGNTPLHLAAAIGHVQLVRALLTAGAGVMNYNLRGQVPLHVAVAAGKKEALKEFVAFHNNRKLPWATLCTQASNDTPLHVAVRTLRIPLFVWMVDNGGFSAGMVMKNVENIDPMKHLKKAQGLLKKMQGYQKKVDKADKKGAPKPPMPAAIIPPAPPPPDLRPLAEQMATQKQGSIQAYLMEDPIYVNFHEVPAPPPEPKGKKKKGGGKAKKEKLIPPPPFICTLGQALEVERTERRGAPYIGEKLKDMEKKYEEEKKAAEKIAAEKAKLKAQAEKEAAAKAAKDKPAGKKK
ncbi:ankyrin repeat domain protein [Chrysochromulina tobinii]|uniref:Ankyrin repeat domain protein n=1 Tax=Chrysochromulina tobinii TaxID=1460289 RepID=A0A0M0JS24_9EUKA|nr:ankyrin repeat domain protein [Chrysochromulina tobinii]|eukprot:KOO29394.1 ankyrin repeat domain protein [Chrysochromulina sp. CCMP291]